MAERQTSTTVTTKPLASTIKLSDTVYLHQPPNISPSTSPSDSQHSDLTLILLLGWVAALDIHLQKYIQHHLSLHPTAHILLIKSHVKTMAFSASARRDVADAILIIRELLPPPLSSYSPLRPQLLIHLFSNGGSRLLAALHESLDALDMRLPERITIFDSSPSTRYSHAQIVRSILVGLRRHGVLFWLAVPILHLMSLIWVVRIRVLGRKDEIASWAAVHNEPGRLVGERGRVYIYGDEDSMVDFKEVEVHAREAELVAAAAATAEGTGGLMVRREIFVRSPHVAHARMDGERYWRIIREAWEGR